MDTADAIQEVISRLTIDDVAHQKSQFFVSDEFLPQNHDDREIRIQLRSNYSDCSVEALDEKSMDDKYINRYRFFYDLGVRLLNTSEFDEEEEPVIISVVETRMYSQYIEANSEQKNLIAKDTLDEFGKANGLYHVWPYWREYVQSALGRLRLPGITIPMFRLPKENWKTQNIEQKP